MEQDLSRRFWELALRASKVAPIVINREFEPSCCLAAAPIAVRLFQEFGFEGRAERCLVSAADRSGFRFGISTLPVLFAFENHFAVKSQKVRVWCDGHIGRQEYFTVRVQHSSDLIGNEIRNLENLPFFGNGNDAAVKHPMDGTAEGNTVSR